VRVFASALAAMLAATMTGLVLRAAPADAGGIVKVSFTKTGETPFRVPAGVTNVYVVADGAPGQAGDATVGGAGTTVTADLPVTPGATLYVEVGAGGGGGGFTDGGAGGGGSDVRTCSVSANNCGGLGTIEDPRLLVAGGGGGGGGLGAGGGAGGAGGSGSSASCNPGGSGSGTGGGGGAGTCTSGGSGGQQGGAGGAGYGGAGGDFGSGGGGGGYYGGGGGGGDDFSTGGGGGSSFAEAAASNVSMTLNNSAAASVTISYSSTVPEAPTGVVATAGNGQATVSWKAPSNGGDQIFDYTVTSDPSGFTTVVNAPATSARLTGLMNGVTYVFTVVARNDVGYGPASYPSNPVTPVRIIPVPTITKIAPDSGKVGTTVTITGTNLSGATKVSFNGEAAVIIKDTATEITTKVPTGAKTGDIQVTTPGGKATSARFTVT